MNDVKFSFLPPDLAVSYIREKGLKTSAKTLAKWRCVGGGPQFRKFGRGVFYEPSALDNWISSRISPARSSTSSK